MDGIDLATTSETRQAGVLLAAIEAMEATFTVAEGLLAGGRHIDLDGLEAEVERLCAACLAVPRGTAPAVRARLLGLLRLLDRLRAALGPP